MLPLDVVDDCDADEGIHKPSSSADKIIIQNKTNKEKIFCWSFIFCEFGYSLSKH